MSTSDTADPVAEANRRWESFEQAQQRVEEYGEDELQKLKDAYESFAEVLSIYQDQVTGDDGDIKTIVEFQSQIDAVMTDIPDSVLLAEIFEECDEYLQQKWFSDDDFEHVYEQLEPAAELVDRLDERDEARSAYRKARRNIEVSIRETKKEIEDLERLARLSDADLTAPTEQLRNPIEEYNDAISTAFREFRAERSAAVVLEFLETMQWYPLIEFERPPESVLEYVRETGTERTIPELLEFAGYSRSKLEHYVDDPDRLKHTIEGKRAYLEGLDASPLTVDWPPPTVTELRYRCRELRAAANRIDPAVVEQLRAVEALPRETEYDRLQTSAVVRAELSRAERERLQNRDIEAELEDARAEVERLESELSVLPKH